MNKTESLNFDGAKNPRQSEQKDQSVDANQELDGKDGKDGKTKKKPNKILAWCGKCCGKGKKKVKKIKKKRKEKKEKKKKDEKQPGKKSFFAKLKNSRCWGRKKKKDAEGKRRDYEEDQREEKGDLYERRAGTSRDSRGRVTIDKSDSRVSFLEKSESMEDSRWERRPRKPKGGDPSHPEKTVSYADTRHVYKTSGKGVESLRDIAKSCCYLCTENSLAIAAAMRLHPALSDKSINVRVTDMLESSCSPMNVHVRTVKSLLRVKVRDTCTSSAGFPQERKVAKPKKKRKKFRFFPKIRRTECPARQPVGCVTESTVKKPKPKPKPKPKEKPKFEPCCRDKAV